MQRHSTPYISSALFACALTAPLASAHDILVAKHAPARIIAVDSDSGAITNSNFVDVDALLGLGGASTNLRDIVLPGNGELWVSDATFGGIHRFSEDGTSFIGSIAGIPAAGGMELDGPNVWIVGLSDVRKIDVATHATVASTSVAVPSDVELFDGFLLVANPGGIHKLDPSTLGYFGTLYSGGLSISQMTALPNGNLLVSSIFPSAALELDTTGATVNLELFSGLAGAQGVAYLGTGAALVSTVADTYVVDQGSASTLDAGAGAYLFHHPGSVGGPIGTPYCTSTANSTGSPASMSAEGAVSVAAADLTLVAGPVPTQPGLFYFGASQSNLAFGNGTRCVGGTVFRLPPAVAVGGELRHVVDFAAAPVQGVIVGNTTWNFQAWFRDPLGGGSFFDLSDGLEISFQP